MRVTLALPLQHDEIVHDVAFDFYGRRLASCSSDHTIKVWDRDDSGSWVCTSAFKAHSGSVWRVAWAHPEFGQVLSSCSFDRSVGIWEEQPDRTWRLQANLVDARDEVFDVKFAPPHLGLKLATVSADGRTRMYEAQDVMNLGHWPLMEEFESHGSGRACLSWNQSRFDPQTVVVGGGKTAKLWLYNDKRRRWDVAGTLEEHRGLVCDVHWAPNMGRPYHLIATASKEGGVRVWRVDWREGRTGMDVREVGAFHDFQATRVEWNIQGTVLASSGDDGTVRMFRCGMEDEWKCVGVIEGGAA